MAANQIRNLVESERLNRTRTYTNALECLEAFQNEIERSAIRAADAKSAQYREFLEEQSRKKQETFDALKLFVSELFDMNHLDIEEDLARKDTRHDH